MSFYICLGRGIPILTTTYALFKFFSAIYKEKFTVEKYTILFCGAVLIQYLVSSFGIPILSLLIFIIVSQILEKFAYFQEKKYKKVLTILYIIYLTAVDMIVVPLYAKMTSLTVSKVLIEEERFFITGIISAIFVLCTFQMLIHILKQRELEYLPDGQHFFMLFLGMFELGISHSVLRQSNYLTTEGNAIIFALFVGFFVIDIYVVLLFEELSRGNYIRINSLLQEKQRVMDEKYYDKLEAQNRKYRKIMHDIREHLNMLDRGIDNSYCDELVNVIGDNIKFKCANPLLTTIVNDKIEVCESLGIRIEWDIEDVDLSFMAKMDITTIFSNLINNAIEACQELEDKEKYVRIIMKERQSQVIVSIENSFQKTRESSLLKPEVSYKKGHMGLGLSNVRDSLNKYESKLDIYQDENKFIARFIISLLQMEYRNKL